MLALIAGQGGLPVYLARRLLDAGARFSVFSLAGFEMQPVAGIAVESFRLEQLGSFLDSLVERGFREVCLAGAIRRPKIDPAQIDTATIPVLGLIKDALESGDDGALRIVLSLIASRGLKIRAAHELAPELLAPAGAMTAVRPEAGLRAQIPVALAALQEMGREDSGQACIVAAGRVIAREGPDGTAGLLAGLGADAAGGFLFKAPKPEQDRRADLPVIGPETAHAALRAGLAGIVVEAGGVMILDRRIVVELLDEAGLFLFGQEAA